MLSSTTLAVFVDVELDIQSQGERHCPTGRSVRHVYVFSYTSERCMYYTFKVKVNVNIQLNVVLHIQSQSERQYPTERCP